MANQSDLELEYENRHSALERIALHERELVDALLTVDRAREIVRGTHFRLTLARNSVRIHEDNIKRLSGLVRGTE